MRLSVHCEWMILRVPREHPSSCLQSWLFRNIRQAHKERGRNQRWVSLNCLGEPGTEVPWALGLCSRGECSPGAWRRGWAWGWWSTHFSAGHVGRAAGMLPAPEAQGHGLWLCSEWQTSSETDWEKFREVVSPLPPLTSDAAVGVDLLPHFILWAYLHFQVCVGEMVARERIGFTDKLSFLGTQVSFLYLQSCTLSIYPLASGAEAIPRYYLRTC